MNVTIPVQCRRCGYPFDVHGSKKADNIGDHVTGAALAAMSTYIQISKIFDHRQLKADALDRPAHCIKS
jgi:hypothetical protein